MKTMQIEVQVNEDGKNVFVWRSPTGEMFSSVVLHAPFNMLPADVWLECGHFSCVIGEMRHIGGHASLSCFCGFEEQYSEPLVSALWITAKYFKSGDMLSLAFRPRGQVQQRHIRLPTHEEYWREMTVLGYSYVQDVAPV